MRYEKIYVDVTVRFLREGGLRPLEIIWSDGKRFNIDKIKFIERAPSKVGGIMTLRFTVNLLGAEKYLYYEKEFDRWFVEKKLL